MATFPTFVTRIPLFILVTTVLMLNIDLVASFKVTRGYGDVFVNPDCDSDICPDICDRYNAKCFDRDPHVKECKQCSCSKEFSLNFVGTGKAEGKCETKDEVNTNSIPKESFMLQDKAEILTYKCAKVDPLLQIDSKCKERDSSFRWILTPDGHLMNLKRLECMDSTNPDYVQVKPCDRLNDAQIWKCNGEISQTDGQTTRRLTYNKDNKMYLTDSYFTGVSWEDDNFCKTPVDYRGCYRFNDGDTMRFLSDSNFRRDCKTDCSTTVKIIAPIYVQNSQCSLSWEKSEFLRNDKPWQPVTGDSTGFSLTHGDDFRGVELEVTRDAYIRWSGTIMKFMVQCAATSTSEEHCVLIKFQTSDMKTQSQSKARSKNDDDDNDGSKYKASTIALSVVVVIAILLLVAAVLYIVKTRSSAQAPFRLQEANA